MSEVIRQPRLEPDPLSLGRTAAPVLDADLAEMIEEASSLAYRRGLEEGVERGRSDALASDRTLIEGLTAGVEEAIVGLRRHYAEAMVEMACDIAEIMFDATPYQGGPILANRLEEALRVVDDRPLSVRLNRADLEGLGVALTERSGVTALADPSLRPGEAVVEGNWARAEITREAIRTAVKEVLDAGA